MQELTSAPQMATPYTPAGGSNLPAAQTPKLGTQIPGTTGGLSAPSGLSVFNNPLPQSLQSSPQQAAQQTQQYGRGEDSMLVHMTPNEVNSLRGLAQRFGGDLSVNPNTGLPEAGWLGKLLPTILGIAGAAFGIPTWAIGLGVGAGQTALTGDLGKGLTAGLQAFGGAGLGQAAGVGGKLGSVGADLGLTKSLTGGVAGATGAPAAQTMTSSGAGAVAPKSPGFLSKFGAETSLGQKGLVGKALPMMAGSAVLGGVSAATAPKMPKYQPEEDEWNYTPMGPGKREVSFQTPEQMRQSGGAEYQYFTPSNPPPVPLTTSGDESTDYGFADGGLASTPQAQGFNDLVSFFNAPNPGAVTASMYPTAPAAPATPPAGTRTIPATPSTTGGETTYNFGRPTTTPTIPSTSNYGYIDIPGIGNIQIPDFSSYNWDNIDWDAIASSQGYIPQSEAVQVNVPSVDLSGIQSQLNNIQQAQQPAFDPSTYDWSSVLPSYEAPDLSGIQSQLSQIQQAQQPAFDPSTYDWSSVLPSYEAPDLSGIQSQLSQIQQAQQPAFDPNSIDWASIFSQYMPTTPTPTTAPAPVPAPTPEYSSYSPQDYLPKDYGFYAGGGEVNMRDGSFVVDARTVSELGNGSSNAGMEMLSRMGGRPVRGPGDGVSDSVRARIGGSQEARVARDEVIFPPEAVRRMGEGSEQRGTAKLYNLMERAHKARKKAGRGQDTKLRRGLA